MKTDYKIIQQTEQNQYWNISKANDALRVMGPHCDGNSFGVATMQTKDKRAVGVDISIRFDPQALGKEVTITAYDMAVMDAVYTQFPLLLLICRLPALMCRGLMFAVDCFFSMIRYNLV